MIFDNEHELKNFQYAGETLAEVWNTLVIANESVTADYLGPVEAEQITDERTGPSSPWYSTHIRESQYMLQISKCQHSKCCSEPRSKLRLVLPNGFLPPPLLLTSGLEAAKPRNEDCHFSPPFVQLAAKIEFPNQEFETTPYDFYCPSVQDKLKSRICSTCGLYFATQKATTEHKRNAHNLACLMNIEAADTPELPVRRSARIIARRGGEVLTELQDEIGVPLDVEWVPAPPDDSGSEEDPEDDLPLIHLIKDVAEWSASPFSQE